MKDIKSYDLLQDIYKHIFEQLKYAELKNGILLTLLIGIFYFIASNLTINFKSIILIFLLINIAMTLLSFYPNLSSFTLFNKKEKDSIKNIYFFESIKHYTHYEYLEILLKENDDLDDKNNKILLDISSQIIVQSNITSTKHFIYKISFIYFCIFSTVTLAIYFIG